MKFGVMTRIVRLLFFTALMILLEIAENKYKKHYNIHDNETNHDQKYLQDNVLGMGCRFTIKSRFFDIRYSII